MPLPDASEAEKSRLYVQFQGLTLLPTGTGAITSDLMDALRNQTFVDTLNEDELRRINLVGAASSTMSFSGPMPDTHVIHNVSTSTTNEANVFFSPGKGEVWKLLGASTAGQTTNGNSINYTLIVGPSGLSGTAVLSAGVVYVSVSTGTTGFLPFSETGTEDAVYVSEDYPLYLYANWSGTAEVNVNASFIRVR
tara:strand:- start:1709 stop:2290 length:582 start_codon:yes stop_codon:yes gene_type:complete